jgi:hypothetical protein
MNSTVIFDPQNYKYLPYVYGIYGTIYCLICMVWIIHLLFRKVFQQGIYLHWVILVTPVCKIVLSFLMAGDNIYCVINGKYGVVSSCTSALTFLTLFGSVFYTIVFINVLLLISHGWYITRTSFYTHEKRTMVWNVFWLAVCKLLMIFSEYFVFPLMIIYCIVYSRVFSSMVENVRGLQIHGMAVRGEDYSTSPTYKKLMLFRQLQIVMGIYLFLVVLTNLVLFLGFDLTLTAAFQSTLLWLKVVVDEFVELGFIVALGIILRMHKPIQRDSIVDSSVTPQDNKAPTILIQSDFGKRKVYSMAVQIV